MAQAAIMLRNGLLVAFPTETVYGLGADARNDRAVAAIFEAKGRPSFNRLIIHVADAAQADRYAVLDDRARSLASQFWPGPLTLVMPRRSDADISWLASAGMETIALRCPSHPVAQDLLRAFGGPVAAPSANLSGTVSATTAGHVAESLTSGVAMILDGGPARHGLESTIVGLTGPEAMLLRPGAIERAMMSVLPPGANGTISRIGRVGQDWDWAWATTDVINPASNRLAQNTRCLCIISSIRGMVAGRG
jgi:L-threonylcarbamoyladenylate synthase